jgi:hypothetical protein
MIEAQIHTLKHFTHVGQAYQRSLARLGRALIIAGQWVLERQTTVCSRCGQDPGWSCTVGKHGKRCDGCRGYQGYHHDK